MNPLTLVIGNRNYSSWSLRAWLALKKSGLAYQEKRLSLFVPEFDAAIPHYSPSGRVPVIVVDGQSIWDSMAVCEYLNECVDGKLWPSDVMARAHARSVAAEMHSGFSALREQMPMNCRAEDRKVPVTADLKSDIDRIQAIWSDARIRFGEGGEWLYGEFSIADAFYAPVVSRFKTYGVQVDELSRQYMTAVLGDADLRDWYQQAREEVEVIEEEEVGI